MKSMSSTIKVTTFTSRVLSSNLEIKWLSFAKTRLSTAQTKIQARVSLHRTTRRIAQRRSTAHSRRRTLERLLIKTTTVVKCFASAWGAERATATQPTAQSTRNHRRSIRPTTKTVGTRPSSTCEANKTRSTQTANHGKTNSPCLPRPSPLHGSIR